jgi:HK97 gp10 family phage protein
VTTLGVHVEIDASRIDAAFKRAGEQFTDAVGSKVGAALKACATLVAADAIKLAPVRYGYLRNSIRADEPHVMESGELGIDIIAGGAEAYYAPYQEFGTRTIPAKRFMRGALEMHEQDIPKILGAAVEAALSEVNG